MKLEFSVIFRKSPLYDNNGKETFTFYVEDGVWSNDIKMAKFFTNEDEFINIKTKLDEEYVNGGQKSYAKFIQFKLQLFKLVKS